MVSDMMGVNKGTNNEYVSNVNRSLIIQYLKKNGVCSRAELSKALGLTGASISKIMTALIDSGIVEEIGYIEGKKGRRSIGLALKTNLYKVIGVKLSRRSFSVGVFDIGGTIYDHCSEQIEFGSQLVDVFERIKKAINNYLERYEDTVVIGIAVPGPFNKRESEILLMTEMDEWVNISLKEAFGNTYKIPVIFEHDANAGALAEWWFGPHQIKSTGTMVHFLVGEGVGAGIISKGNIISGSQGIAGEIGHISIDVNGKRCSCGNYGCLEKYCSSLAFLKHVKEELKTKTSSLSKINFLTVEDVFQAAKNGDELAITFVKEVAQYIGYGVVTLVNAYNPDIIVISNIMTQGGDLLLDEVKQIAKERLLDNIYKNTQIIFSEFSSDPTLFGAAAVAIDRVLNQPSLFLKNIGGN